MLFHVTHFGASGKATKDYMVASFPKVMKMERLETLKIEFSSSPLSFDVPSPRKPREYSHELYSARNYRCRCVRLHRRQLTLRIYLYLNFRGGIRKTHLFWHRVHEGRSRSSKVIDFSTNRKRVCNVLLVINSNLGLIFPDRTYCTFSD